MIDTQRYVMLIDNLNKITIELNEKSKTWKCLKTIKDKDKIFFIKDKEYTKVGHNSSGELILLDEENEKHVIGCDWNKYFTIFL